MADTSKHTILNTHNLLGKLPPQARDLEEAVLGAAMLEKDGLHKISDMLKPHMFYVDAHQLIFQAILDLFQEDKPTDLLLVTEKLRENGTLDMVGGPLKITTLTSRVASAANIRHHAEIIAEKYAMREMIAIGNEGINLAYDDTIGSEEIYELYNTRLSALTEQTQRGRSVSAKVASKNAIDNIEAIKDHNIVGIDTGFVELNKATAGWRNRNLYIQAARPGMGKTTQLMVHIATACKLGIPVAWASLEMGEFKLMKRLFSYESGIPYWKIDRNVMTDSERAAMLLAAGRISGWPLEIIDTPGLNIHELRAKVFALLRKFKLGLLGVDYLQLMSGTGKEGSRELIVSGISRGLKQMAMELDIPIIAVSQLNRSVETRGGDKRPMLADLRESGAIEQDADMVSFLYRPEYYDILEDSQGRSTKHLAEIIIEKNRDGGTGTVRAHFHGPTYSLTDWKE